MNADVIDRLTLEAGWPVLDADNFAPFVGAGGFSVVLCTEDPGRYPESIDVAVVLPELVAAAPLRLRPAICARGFERELQSRYDFHAWPALLFFQGDKHLGTIVRMHDWSEFLVRMGRILPQPRAVDDDQRRSA